MPVYGGAAVGSCITKLLINIVERIKERLPFSNKVVYMEHFFVPTKIC